MGHSRSHVIAQRERHKRREREYRAQRGWDNPLWPAHKPRSRSCTCPRCQRGRAVQQYIDRDADTADLEAIDHGVHG